MRYGRRRRPRLGVGLLSAVMLCAAVLLPRGTSHAGGFLGKLGKALSTCNEMNYYLFLLGDTGAERRLGFLLSRFVMATNRLDDDPQRRAWVENIFRKVAANARRRGIRYRIYVIRSKQVNAFALPGGYIFVYTGMLDFVRSDDELACVLGHEIGHAFRRHALLRLRKSAAFLYLLKKLSHGDESMETAGKIFLLFDSLSFSRANEREADRLGMQFAWAAGYDPSGMVTLWERMERKYPSSRNFLSKMLATHPTHPERIRAARRWLAEHGLPFRETNFLSYRPRNRSREELLANGSFERIRRDGPEGEPSPQAWKLLEGSALTNAVSASGRWSVVCSNSSSTSWCEFQSEPFELPREGKAWRVSFKARCERGSEHSELRVRCFDSEGHPLADVDPLGGIAAPSSSEWRIFEGTFGRGDEVPPEIRVPAGTVKAALIVRACKYTPGTCWFDDFSVTPADAGGGPSGRGRASLHPGKPNSTDAAAYGEVSSRTVMEPTDNLLPNGDFEEDADRDGKPDRWSCTAGVTVIFDADQALNGYGACLLSGSETARRFLASDYVPLDPRRQYLFRMGARSLQGHGAIECRFKWFDSNKRLLQASRPESPPVAFHPGREWGIADARLFPPPGTAFVRVFVKLASRSYRDRVLIDAATLLDAGARPGY